MCRVHLLLKNIDSIFFEFLYFILDLILNLAYKIVCFCIGSFFCLVVRQLTIADI